MEARRAGAFMSCVRACDRSPVSADRWAPRDTVAGLSEGLSPFVECTLMPTNIRGFFSAEQLRAAELVSGDRYSNGLPYLKMRSRTYMNSYDFGSSLWDVRAGEERIEDAALEARLTEALAAEMRRCEAPAEEFERLGLTV